MTRILHVENSPTVRAGVRSVCRRVGADLIEAASIEAAMIAIRVLAPLTFALAILDWSLADGCADELLPLLPSTRIVILSAKAPSVPGAVVIPKEGDWQKALEEELRK
jgi:DNA-binding response OmpR family regulator